MKPIKLFLALCVGLLLISCADKPELIKNNNPQNYTVVNDVQWAAPGGVELSMDIYTPTSGKASYPVLVMFHGGGWLINNKSIMDQPAKYLASNSEYVICNVDYRLLADDHNSVNLNQIVEDVFGAVLWVKDHISHYKGDNTKVAVTGDSAGGHLSAMIVNLGRQLSSRPYSEQSPAFNPTYLPKGQSAEQVAQSNGLAVQAAILSYGSFDFYQAGLDGFERFKNPFWLISGSLARGVFGGDYNAQDNPALYKAVSPTYHIPQASQQPLPPQLLTVGTDDILVSPESVRNYLAKLRAAGHSAEYWQHEGRGHAYLDSGANRLLGTSFEDDAPPALDVMISFLDKVFYSNTVSTR